MNTLREALLTMLPQLENLIEEADTFLDWFRLVLWYIRIRKATKTGTIHSSLLEIECRAGPSKKVIDPKRAVR